MADWQYQGKQTFTDRMEGLGQGFWRLISLIINFYKLIVKLINLT